MQSLVGMNPLFDQSIKKDEADEGYIHIRDSELFTSEKAFLENNWVKCHSYLDSTFLNEFHKEGRFKERVWELLVANYLVDQGLSLIKKNSNDGPDFCIQPQTTTKKIWIEATFPGPGTRVDAVPNYSYNEGNGHVPEEKIIFRYRNSLEEKKDQFIANSPKITQVNDGFIVAINGSGIPYAAHEQLDLLHTGWMPKFIKAVYPYGQFKVKYASNFQQKEIHIDWRDKVFKTSGNPVSTDYFLSEESSNISGLLFSNIDISTLNTKMPNFSDNFFLVHNHAAKQRIPLKFFKVGIEFWWDEDTERLDWTKSEYWQESTKRFSEQQKQATEIIDDLINDKPS